ncbi:TIGR00255 family protein [Roseivivax marinus]|uniref:YicC/YloC family endoribonuclease n=1 Tax=Roseivivax marinus TaxID=1379903 RepID=UPI0008D7D47F|nr:YicC/YloC family endoribonuclease [Roseivivax marinus]SEK78846.1 TIGR00255 family protein [Roseivivax marinus]
MRQSMTGFAARQGAGAGASWTWEVRSVNGKGLELRTRLPDGIEGLEPAVRAAFQAKLSRGSVSVTLRLASDGQALEMTLNEAVLSGALRALARIEAEAHTAGLSVGPTSAAEIAALRGMTEWTQATPDPEALKSELLADLEVLVDDLVAMRTAEGARISEVLTGQLATVATLAEQAREAAATRGAEQAERLATQIARITGATDAVDPDRLAQELALIAVKSDVTEEIDRLDAHVSAARALLEDPEPVGRRLDFLMQEFNREANTLCAKAGSTALTQTGLALKTAIDQMREQVQNVE